MLLLVLLLDPEGEANKPAVDDAGADRVETVLCNTDSLPRPAAAIRWPCNAKLCTSGAYPTQTIIKTTQKTVPFT